MIGAFLLSRLLVLTIFVLCAAAEFIPAQGWIRPEKSLLIRLDQPALRANLTQTFYSGDGHNYLAIARDGYDPNGSDASGMRNWVFFPLYPLVVRGAAAVTGHLLLSALTLSHIFFLIGLVALHRLMVARTGDEKTASRAAFFLALNPMAYFFSLPMTESLFLALFTGALFFAETAKPLLGAALMALLTACRPTGLLLLPGFGVTVAQRHGWKTALLSTGIGAGGVLGFAIFLHDRAGNPLIFITNQAEWNRSGSLLTLFRAADPLIVSTGWNFLWLNVFGLIAAAAIAVWSIKRRQFGDAVSIVIPLAALMSTGTVLSAFRILMPLFPIWFGLAVFAKSEERQRMVIAISAGCLALLTACYALGINSALI